MQKTGRICSRSHVNQFALPICGLLNWSLSSVQKDQLASGMRWVRIPEADRTARLLTLFRRVYCMPRQFPVPLASQILPAPANYITVLLTILIRVHEYVCVHTSKSAFMSWQNSHAGVGLWYILIFFLFVLFNPHYCAYWCRKYVNLCPSPHVRRSKRSLPRQYPGSVPRHPKSSKSLPADDHPLILSSASQSID